MKNLKYLIFLFTILILGQMDLASQDRHFVWTYESNTLPKGGIDIEPWVTYSTGRDHFYNKYATRLEFEIGVTDRLQTAIYLNSEHTAEAVFDTSGNLTGIERSSGYSMSNEWKFNVLNPSVKPIGLGLYGEYSLVPNEFEIEGKLLLDKKTAQ